MTKTTASAPAAPSPAPAAAAPAAATPAPAAKPAEAAPAASETKPETAALPQLGEADATDETAVPALGADDGGDADPEEGDEAPEGDEPAADGDAEAEADEAPIAYEFEAPEGAAPYRAEVLDAYKAVLQQHKVAPEVATSILEAMHPVIQASVDAQVKEQIETTTTAWRQQFLERHGTKAAEVRRLANRALAKAGTPELIALLRGSALAENPDFNDLLAAFGRQVSNDRSVSSRGVPGRQQPLDPVDEIARQYEEEDAAAAQ